MSILKKIPVILIRSFAFCIGYFGYFLEIAMDAFLFMSKRTEYIRKGSCSNCGRCCYNLAIQIPATWVSFGFIIKFLQKWHYIAYNFKPLGVYEGWLVYKCAYLNDKNFCSIYPFRHRICRQFPYLKLYGRPNVHRNCGFYFERRDGKPIFEEVFRQKLMGSDLHFHTSLKH
ncbi:YkgJ family cysteine cluster protein [bacterium]|nr:YkgJ family cysteine cluster protein [bacterium]